MTVSTLKIDPRLLPIDWQPGTTYTISMGSDFVREVGNNRSPNPVRTATITTFSDIPSISSVSPAYATTASYVGTATLTFSRPVDRGLDGSKNFYLYRQSQSGNTLIATIPVNDARITFVGNDARVNFIGLIEANQTYYLTADQGVAVDMFKFQNAAITNDTVFKYTIGFGPEVVSTIPAYGTTGSFQLTPSLIYDRNIFNPLENKNFYLYKQDEGLIETFSSTGTRVTRSGNSSTINLAGYLEGSRQYHITADEGVFIDGIRLKSTEIDDDSKIKYSTGIGPEFVSVGLPYNFDWDISQSNFDESFEIEFDELDPHGIFFKPDGLKMYIVGEYTKTIREYNLSRPWRISSAVFLRSLNVSAVEETPKAVFFKPDGLIMYITGYEPGNIEQYNLSIPWDISSAVYFQTKEYLNAKPTGIFFKPDGLKMYVLFDASNTINEFNLTVAWDISTAGTTPVSFKTTVVTGAINDSPTGLFFKPDGTKAFMTGRSITGVQEHTLDVPWDISTLNYNRIYTVTQENDITGVAFKPDGLSMFVIGKSGLTGDVYSYNLLGIRYFPTPLTEEVTAFVSTATIRFNKQIIKNENSVKIYNGEGIFRTIPVTSSSFSLLNTNTVLLSLYNEAIPEDQYHIQLDRGIVKDSPGLVSHPVNDDTLIKWTSQSLDGIDNGVYDSKIASTQTFYIQVLDRSPNTNQQYTLTLSATSGTFTATSGTVVSGVWSYTGTRQQIDSLPSLYFNADVKDMNWDLPFNAQLIRDGVTVANRNNTLVGLPYDTTLTLVSNTYTNSIGSSTVFTVVANTNSAISSQLEFKTATTSLGTATFINNEASIIIPPQGFGLSPGTFDVFVDWDGQTYAPKFNGTDSNTITQVILPLSVTTLTMTLSTATYYVRSEVGSGTNPLPSILSLVTGIYPTHTPTGNIEFIEVPNKPLGTVTLSAQSTATFTWDPSTFEQVDKSQRTIFGFYQGDDWNSASNISRGFQAFLRNSATIEVSVIDTVIYRPNIFTVTSQVSTVNMNGKTISWYNDNVFVTNTNFVNQLSNIVLDSMALSTGSHAVKVTFDGDYNFSPVTTIRSYSILKQPPLFTLQRDSQQVPLFDSIDTFTFNVQPELNGKTITYYDEYSNFTGTTVVSNGTATFVTALTTSTTLDPAYQNNSSDVLASYLHRIRANITGTDVFDDRSISLTFFKTDAVAYEFEYDSTDGVWGSVSVKNLERIPNEYRSGSTYSFVANYREENGDIITTENISLTDFTKYNLISTDPAWNYVTIELRYVGGDQWQFPVESDIEITAAKSIRYISPVGLYFPGNDIPGL